MINHVSDMHLCLPVPLPKDRSFIVNEWLFLPLENALKVLVGRIKMDSFHNDELCRFFSRQMGVL